MKKKLALLLSCFFLMTLLLSACGYNSHDLDVAYDAGHDSGYKEGYEEGYSAGLSNSDTYPISLYEAMERASSDEIAQFNKDSEYFAIWSIEDLQALFAYAMQRGYVVGKTGNWDATAEEYINGYEVSQDAESFEKQFGVGTTSTEGSSLDNTGLSLLSIPSRSVATSLVPAATDYVLNTNSKKFHYPYCESVGDMAEKNKQLFSGTRGEVIAMGYVPCKRCTP